MKREEATKKKQAEVMMELLNDVQARIDGNDDFFVLAFVVENEVPKIMALANATQYDIADAIAQYLDEVPSVRAAFAERLFESMKDELMMNITPSSNSVN